MTLQAKLTLTLLLSIATASLQAAVPDDIRALAANAKLAPQADQRPYDERDWLERFYGPRLYAPVWQGKAATAIAVLQGATENGLLPSEYQADELQQRLLSGAALDAATDVALTRAVLHYLADLRVGRVRSAYHTALPDPRLKAFDPVEQLRSGVEGNRLAAVAASAEPRVTIYRRVKSALAHYRVMATAPRITLPALAKGEKVEVDAPYAAAPELRALLTTLGDLAPGAAVDVDDHYTAELADAVKHFQARHGLLDDGILGRDTVATMNMPLKARVRQLELSLERLRWLPDMASGPVIAVNLPAFRLWAWDTGKPDQPLEMRVIVGSAVKTETPLFVGSMRYIEFNPYWNVPRSIEKAELIPKLQKDANYLVKNDMEMVPLKGGAPTQVADVEGLSAGNYRVRQRPGPQNALGAVKFAMPNPDNIYLHSTSARELFKRTRRDLSHGCIRVEKPLELAQFVLAGRPDWEPEKIAAAMEPGESKTVSLKTPVPVVLFYTTAIADAEGHAIFSPDVYKRDPMLEKLLGKHDEAKPVVRKP
ncbi:MAG: L,D-transpeptidase family protein [Pseudomonadota bacterium]